MDNIFAKPITKAIEILGKGLLTKDTSDTPVEDNEVFKTEDIPASLYSQRFNKPLASEYFGLNSRFFLNLDSETAKNLSIIDDYILREIREHSYEDTKGNYYDILDSLSQVIDVDGREKTEVKIEKITTAILLRKLLSSSTKKSINSLLVKFLSQK